MKTLVLITSQFPFGTGESFIGPEFSVVSQNFDKKIIIAQNISGERTSNVPDDVTVYRYNPSTSLSGFLQLPFLVLIHLPLLIHLIKDEVTFRNNIGFTITLPGFLNLIKKILKAFQLRDFIRKKLNFHNINESIVFYSYWLKTGAHAIAMLQYRESIKIARAHGSDLYEEKTRPGYLPLLNFTVKNLNAIFFVSKQGKRYLENKLNIESPAYFVSYLGTEKTDNEEIRIEKSTKYVIVSCSNLIPLKRIDLIIYALEKVHSDREIYWFHFGDGILRKDLENLATAHLGNLERINFNFMGHYPNNRLMEFYRSNKIALFINTSSTEGVPVSIMEAQSFGIPVIATDVGGVNEVVIPETGDLLPADFKPEVLAEMIQRYSRLPEEEEKKIRMAAFRNWKLNFDASLNYKEFVIRVNSILASVKEES